MTSKHAQPKLVVGVGASAGGLEAFKQFLATLPADTDMAFLLVQHLDPNHRSLLPQLLSTCTRMAICDADQDVELEANTVYVIRPGTALAVRQGKIEISEPTLHRGVRLPIDHLFRSLAREYGPRAAAIVLSGAGSDGSAGIRAIKAAGGLVIAQEPEASGHRGMPQSAIDTGVVDLVLEIAEMPAALERFASLPPRARIEPASESTAEREERMTRLSDPDLARLAAILAAQLDFDLRVYEPATIERSVLRRMDLSGLDDVESYSSHLRKDPDERQTLVRDLLISVTEELQSANEELQATTEELRSLNEELTTVNSQLREKVEHVEQTHDDLRNFFSSTKIATIFLDERLRIKRFTPAARELLCIDHADMGRRAGSVACELLHEGLERDAHDVLEHLSTHSRELQTNDGRWISRQVLPYRTQCRRIEGVVVTFVDITALKSATERLSLRERQQTIIARIGLHALREPSLQGFMDQVVRDVHETLDVDCSKILELQPGHETLLLRAGVGWKPGLVGSARVGTRADSQAGYTLQSAEPVIVDDLSKERRFSGPPLLIDHGVISGLSCVIQDGGHNYGVIGAHTVNPRVFSPEDASFLQAVANVVGSAVGRHQAQLRLALERGIARALTESATLDEGLLKVLDCFATELRACIGEVWWPPSGGQPLSCRLRHVVPASDAGRVEEILGRTGSVSEDLVAHVFETDSPAWCAELGDPSMVERCRGAQELGLLTGLAVPVRFGREVIGVIAVLSRERMFADDSFLRSLEGIGGSVGDFVTRSELEMRAHRLAAITESSHDAILCYDYEGTVTEWMPGAERLFGYSTEEMIGRSMTRIIPEDRRKQLWEVNARIARGEVVEPYETERLRKDGERVTVSVRSSPVVDESGKVIGISSADRDVTHYKEAKQRLVEADRQKDDFIAMLGHELRNPLAAIRNASEVLKLRGQHPSTLTRTQAIIERQSGHMAKLLDGLLDISRIIRGKIQLQTQLVDFAEVCREVSADAAERLAARTLELRTELPSEPVWLEADLIRLTQIVDNLLSNAAKYTPDGGSIAVVLTREDGTARLSVSDTGIGIEPQFLPYIFEVFRQSKQNLDRSHGGLGLGLALVKSLAELHGGSVEAKSGGKDLGAEFIVRLPLGKDAGPHTDARAAQGKGTANILIIEDNVDAAEMLKQVLELMGHHVIMATRGTEGIAKAREHEPDVIICDLGLPDGISGFDVARELRGAPATRRIHLIALSGYGRPEDKAASKDAGFDTHVTKPVDVQTLERVLEDVGLWSARGQKA